MITFINQLFSKYSLAFIVIALFPFTISAQTSIGTKESNRSVISPTKLNRVTPKQEIRLPDLVVDKIYLDKRCNIGFKLRNRGHGAIPNDQHQLARVTIYYYKLPMRKPVAFNVYRFSDAVDPRGALKSPRGSVLYSTNIRLSQPHQVEVNVDSKHDVDELNEANNRPNAVTLNPRLCRDRLSPEIR